ncbi:hypothetical protein [Nonomuraea fuscirosea]|uniref:hypothetical protein n=1 Tax=Nonomuraea fuscirosea TaxID=1291556 RepID=UPI00343EAD70
MFVIGGPLPGVLQTIGDVFPLKQVAHALLASLDGRPCVATVGGRITGVDESFHVKVLQREVLGEVRGIPGGGENQPWTAKVSFTAARRRTVTVVAATGGHIAEVEQFAVTGGPAS